MPTPSERFEQSVEQIRLEMEAYEIGVTLDGLVAKGLLTAVEKDGTTHYRVPDVL